MKHTAKGLVLSTLLLAGCDENARRMATEARSVLDGYEKQLELKIAAEQLAYHKQGLIEAEANREQAFANLEQERTERARGFAADLVENQKRASKWRQELRDYAQVDFTVQREFLLENLNSEARFLDKILALEVNKAKITALSKALDALTKQAKLVDQAQELGNFADETQTAFDKDVCSGLKDDLANKTGVAAAAKKRVDDLTAAQAPKDDIDAAIADRKKADIAVAAISKSRDEKGCTALEKPKT
jgi:hypothetical protein